MSSTILILGLILGSASVSQTGLDLGDALLRHAGADPEACPETIVEMAGADREARCGRGPAKFGAFKKSFESTLKAREFARYGFEHATAWEKHGNTMHRAYWLGAVSIEVVYDRGSGTAGMLVSRSYMRCGDDLPFTPPGFAGADDAPASLQLSPLSYPDRAERGKIDGSVGLAVDFDADGKPTVRCIHHASPAGYGFEYHAIESVRRWNETFLETDSSALRSPTNVLVLFSKASSRKRGTAVSYH